MWKITFVNLQTLSQVKHSKLATFTELHLNVYIHIIQSGVHFNNYLLLILICNKIQKKVELNTLQILLSLKHAFNICNYVMHLFLLSKQMVMTVYIVRSILFWHWSFHITFQMLSPLNSTILLTAPLVTKELHHLILFSDRTWVFFFLNFLLCSL